MARKKNFEISSVVTATLVMLPLTAQFTQADDASKMDALCETVVAIESVLSSTIPLNVMPYEVAEEIAGSHLKILTPLFEKANELAPVDISEAMAIYSSTTLQMLDKLEFGLVLTPEFLSADDQIDSKLLSKCSFTEMPVTATNYEYLNIQDTMPIGNTALTLKNVSDEVHEISISRINDDIDLTARDILMLGVEDALASITLVGYAAVEPNQSETTFMNLTSGRYYAVCFTATGTTSLHHAAEGPPHMLRGMLKEFVVE